MRQCHNHAYIWTRTTVKGTHLKTIFIQYCHLHCDDYIIYRDLPKVKISLTCAKELLPQSSQHHVQSYLCLQRFTDWICPNKISLFQKKTLLIGGPAWAETTPNTRLLRRHRLHGNVRKTRQSRCSLELIIRLVTGGVQHCPTRLAGVNSVTSIVLTL